MTLALEHLNKLGVPSTFEGRYTQEEAVKLLQGHPLDSAKADVIHAKLAAIAGVQLTGLLEKAMPGVRWRERVLVRTLPFGESSASFLSFEDDSHAILVSKALQESLIRMANVLVYFDCATSLARRSLRRKTRERRNLEAATRVTALLRYMVLGQRMTGRAPSALAVLDDESFKYAGEIVGSAVMFIVAHELAHIAHNHVSASTQPYNASGKTSIGEVQELQADHWAVNCIADLLDRGDSLKVNGMSSRELALWSAFLGLFATQLTEQAIYVRRNRTHPEAWARWAVLEQLNEKSEERAETLRLAFMCAVLGATKLDEQLPSEAWKFLWTDEQLTTEEGITPKILQAWDLRQTCPLDQLLPEARRLATPTGLTFLKELAAGELALALSRIGIPDRRLGRILDTGSALEFSTLRKAIEEASGTLASEEKEVFSVAAVRLASNQLRSEERE